MNAISPVLPLNVSQDQRLIGSDKLSRRTRPILHRDDLIDWLFLQYKLTHHQSCAITFDYMMYSKSLVDTMRKHDGLSHKDWEMSIKKETIKSPKDTLIEYSVGLLYIHDRLYFESLFRNVPMIFFIGELLLGLDLRGRIRRHTVHGQTWVRSGTRFEREYGFAINVPIKKYHSQPRKRQSVISGPREARYVVLLK